MFESFKNWFYRKKWERWVQNQEKDYQKRRKFYQKKVLAVSPLDIPEESFLINRDEIRIVDRLSDYRLPDGVVGYIIRQAYNEALPRCIISYEEALHLADIIALVRYDDPNINVSNAIRHYLGKTHTRYLSELGLSRQDLEQMDKTSLIKYMTVAKEWKGSEMVDAIRHERNIIAIKQNIQSEIDGDEYTTGYVDIIKDAKLYSVWVSNPEVHDKHLAGPLPVLVNVASRRYSGKGINGPSSYGFYRCYGHITFPMLDFAGDRDYYYPFI